MRILQLAWHMYKKYFGLQRSPFSITPDPQFLFLSKRHREALAHLHYSIQGSSGFVMLSGEVGTGKTTLSRCLLDQLSDKADMALIFNPKLTAPELIASICDELAIPYGDTSSMKVLYDALNNFLLKNYGDGRTTVLIVDEAQNLSGELLEQIRLLSNLETVSKKLLQIILIGQPELIQLLARSDLRQFSQRITARYHITPLSRKETAEYIGFRLTVAGATRSLFTPGATRKVHHLSGGLPRMINKICDRALLGAYVKGQPRVDAATVKEAAKEVLDPKPRPTWYAPAAMTLVGAALGFSFWFAFHNVPGIQSRIQNFFHTIETRSIAHLTRLFPAPEDSGRPAATGKPVVARAHPPKTSAKPPPTPPADAATDVVAAAKPAGPEKNRVTTAKNTAPAPKKTPPAKEPPVPKADIVSAPPIDRRPAQSAPIAEPAQKTTPTQPKTAPPIVSERATGDGDAAAGGNPPPVTTTVAKKKAPRAQPAARPVAESAPPQDRKTIVATDIAAQKVPKTTNNRSTEPMPDGYDRQRLEAKTPSRSGDRPSAEPVTGRKEKSPGGTPPTAVKKTVQDNRSKTTPATPPPERVATGAPAKGLPEPGRPLARPDSLSTASRTAEKTGESPINQPFRNAPPVPMNVVSNDRNDLETVFSDAHLQTQQWAALKNLFSLWKIDPSKVSPRPTCAGDGRRAGAICKTYSSTWREIAIMGLPVIIRLLGNDLKEHFAIVTALNPQRVSLSFGKREMTLPINLVTAYWDGTFTTLLRTTPGNQKFLLPGHKSLDTLWLRQKLKKILGPERPDAAEPLLFDPALKRRVQLFQKKTMLQPDGIVGPMTILKLDMFSRDPARPVPRLGPINVKQVE